MNCNLFSGCNPFWLKSLLGCPIDDLLLMVFVQIHEVVAVPGHAHQKVGIVVRRGLGFFQCVRVHDVELDVVPVEPEVGADELYQLVQILFCFEYVRQEALVQQGAAGLPNWRFLAADATTIDALGENLGFLFYPSAKGFDHLAQTTIVDRNGVIYRQLYGVDITTQALVEPLKELVFDTPRSAGLVEHWVSTFKLFCTVYDPNSDRYRFDYSILMTIAVGLLSLGAIATFVVREWRNAR